MKIQFLGTGTSTGVPQIGCRCQVCKSDDIRDKRLRASVRIEADNNVLLIDCTPDFRQQVMNLPFRKIDGILFTHEHYDHISGIDDLRPFGVFGPVDLYMEERLEKNLYERMPYCFGTNKYGGVPEITIHQINSTTPFFVNETEIIPIRLMHYKLPILGFRIKNMAYLTDVKIILEEEFFKLQNLNILIIDALRVQEHVSHMNLEQAILTAQKINPRITYFTHMSHEIGLHSEIEKNLPPNMFFAYDGLELNEIK